MTKSGSASGKSEVFNDPTIQAALRDYNLEPRLGT